MVKAVPDILARIIDQKKAAPRRVTPELEEAAERSVTGRRDFSAALAGTTPAIIAEIKKASPSKGVLASDFDPVAIARSYELGGAAALSVLTDAPNFQGNLDHLRAARSQVSLPVLRKDFTIGEFDVIEAAAAGADAILLIAAILDELQLRRYRELAEQYRISALVEVHNEEELAAAAASGAGVIGVNNRNLRTFEVNLNVALRLAVRMPKCAIRVAESGIHSASDIRMLRTAGYSAFLVGEHLMKSGDPAAAIQALIAQ
jgi:indole-3-glycerol phosphate synthase